MGVKVSSFLISDELHKKFKIKLAQEGRSQKEVFITWIEIYVKGDGNGREKKDRSGKSSQKS